MEEDERRGDDTADLPRALADVPQCLEPHLELGVRSFGEGSERTVDLVVLDLIVGECATRDLLYGRRNPIPAST
ncbi:hypothetical protein FHR32_008624 [Streptosporangium album]|uniref:Uncharacterized protein n=1 Tax=Streptosporangium album TaxID=47479 RepID=A0A7W7WEK2_9ACTN|nr:hypothetical protein [Streptosporangium album]